MKLRAQNKSLEKQGLEILRLLRQSGFEAFWVGGAVRDRLLGRMYDNLDIATDGPPASIRALLRAGGYHTSAPGLKFGTVRAHTSGGLVEITSFRKEAGYVKRRRPGQVKFIADLKTDSARRDFTINALYFDPESGKIADPQNGRRDIDGKLIRFIGNPRQRIDEDALRMLRAARLSTQLGFRIEKNSFAAIKTRSKYLQQISGERIKSELDKILACKNREQGIRLLDELGLLRFILPELTDLKIVFHKSKLYHLEGSVFEHSLLVLRNLNSQDLDLAYAALAHDFGKAVTAAPKQKPEGLVNSFPDHELASAAMFKKTAARLKFSRQSRNIILWITRNHMKRIAFVKDMAADKQTELASHKFFPKLIELWKADALSNYKLENGNIRPGKPIAWKKARKLLANIQTKKKIIGKIANGNFIMRQLKTSSGPEVGRIKNILIEKILSGQIKNSAGAKKYFRRLKKIS